MASVADWVAGRGSPSDTAAVASASPLSTSLSLPAASALLAAAASLSCCCWRLPAAEDLDTETDMGEAGLAALVGRRAAGDL